jgi:hypothetical protein
MHNTLAASDYSLLTNDTFQPKPNFWAAVLWKKTMGTTVLNPGPSSDPALRIYAQCAKGAKDGITLLVLNTDKSEKHLIVLPVAAQRYALTSDALDSTTVSLNGTALQTPPDGSLPPISGQPVSAGTVTLDPESITFLTISSAKNQSCK